MARENYEDVYSVISSKDSFESGDERDHTYDTAKFDNQTDHDMPHEQSQYNTLQHRNNGTTKCNLRFDDAYEKIYTSKDIDANKCSNSVKQISRISHKTVSYYDYVEDKRDTTPQMVPQNYEQIYHEPNCTQVHNPTGKQLDCDDKTYEAAVQLGVNGIKSTSHSETVKDKTPTTNKEVQYAEPLAPNDKSHVLRDVQADGEHFYHSLELNEPMNPEKCISGDPYSKQCSNPVVMKECTFGSNIYLTSKSKSSKLAALPIRDQVTADAKCQAHTFTTLYDTCSDNTMGEAGATNAPVQCEFDDPMYEGIPHSAPKRANNKNPTLSKVHIEIPEEASCIGGVNAHPDFLMDREEDTNTPRYSDPGCLDDTNMANGQEDTIVNIYDTSDDPIF